MYEDIKDEHDPKEEYEFEEQAKSYLGDYESMKKKYQHLILKQSQVFIKSNVVINLIYSILSYFSNMHQHLS